MMMMMMMMMMMFTVDYILKDPTERERLNVHLTPRVYPQWLVTVAISVVYIKI